MIFTGCNMTYSWDSVSTIRCPDINSVCGCRQGYYNRFYVTEVPVLRTMYIRIT